MEVWPPLSTEHALCEDIKACKRAKPNSGFAWICTMNLCGCHTVPFHDSAMLTPALVTGICPWAMLRNSTIFRLCDQNEDYIQETAVIMSAGTRMVQAVQAVIKLRQAWLSLKMSYLQYCDIKEADRRKLAAYLCSSYKAYLSLCLHLLSLERASWIVYSFSQLFCVHIILSVCNIFDILGDFQPQACPWEESLLLACVGSAILLIPLWRCLRENDFSPALLSFPA